jgi:hypothetical protein
MKIEVIEETTSPDGNLVKIEHKTEITVPFPVYLLGLPIGAAGFLATGWALGEAAETWRWVFIPLWAPVCLVLGVASAAYGYVRFAKAQP